MGKDVGPLHSFRAQSGWAIAVKHGGFSIVYVVDDDAPVRDSTMALLASYDIPARGFASAREFLAEFDSERAGCLILDLHMPGMSGYELLQLLRARGIRTPIFVMTGRGDEALAERVRRADAIAMLAKPVDDKQLIALVELALATNRGK